LAKDPDMRTLSWDVLPTVATSPTAAGGTGAILSKVTNYMESISILLFLLIFAKVY
jgi:hypothetical protein